MPNSPGHVMATRVLYVVLDSLEMCSFMGSEAGTAVMYPNLVEVHVRRVALCNTMSGII
jgi:hypothetical protein